MWFRPFQSMRRKWQKPNLEAHLILGQTHAPHQVGNPSALGASTFEGEMIGNTPVRLANAGILMMSLGYPVARHVSLESPVTIGNIPLIQHASGAKKRYLQSDVGVTGHMSQGQKHIRSPQLVYLLTWTVKN